MSKPTRRRCTGCDEEKPPVAFDGSSRACRECVRRVRLASTTLAERLGVPDAAGQAGAGRSRGA